MTVRKLDEKVAWGFIENQDNQLEFAIINSVAMLGPLLDNHVSGSFNIIKNLFNISLNVVDVRDVVRLYILAMMMPEENNQRFIATADGPISMPEITKLIKNIRPN